MGSISYSNANQLLLVAWALYEMDLEGAYSSGTFLKSHICSDSQKEEWLNVYPNSSILN